MKLVIALNTPRGKAGLDIGGSCQSPHDSATEHPWRGAGSTTRAKAQAAASAHHTMSLGKKREKPEAPQRRGSWGAPVTRRKRSQSMRSRQIKTMRV